MKTFYVDIAWKPLGKQYMVTIHRIQWQQCYSCPPLRLLIISPEFANFKKFIVEIEVQSKNFHSIDHLLKPS